MVRYVKPNMPGVHLEKVGGGMSFWGMVIIISIIGVTILGITVLIS